ncbi:hypothetical protein BCR33DRAFT_114518 [Rhizoclosmatium globosum]|uniref:DUF803-domain-containing protein n=1 Tax=Rhizoclosmatium globosum TaxID=329046 RepID=A0A1Y2CIX4_9FUNG|nr:hypothetical protein BCR33DRAFT_114518 [Rhizoclosmatium globosum]|eukprot:ORY46982.1 hypothetical protein BCR33DRAFT_114518 [Rhizoclosmatium globosum]
MSFIGKMGCGICIFGVLEIVVHVLTDQQVLTVPIFMAYVTSTSFLVYSAFITVLVLFLKFYAEPRYAKKTPFVYIAMSSCGGSYLVLSAQGVGSAIAYSTKNWTTDNQFLQWPLYPLILFMVLAVIYQITYLNKALAVNSSAVIYPISFVCFNVMTLISTAFLYFKLPVDNVEDGISVVVGLLTIIGGVVLLSISKNESKMIIEQDSLNDISTEKLLRVQPRILQKAIFQYRMA